MKFTEDQNQSSTSTAVNVTSNHMQRTCLSVDAPPRGKSSESVICKQQSSFGFHHAATLLFASC